MNTQTDKKLATPAKHGHLAIDLGASSGRHILGWQENGILKTKEIYRFKNSPKKNATGQDIWDVADIFKHILHGISICEPRPSTIGIDSWGVDYALLDENKNLIGDVISYRDPRTKESAKAVHALICENDLYSKTGIATQEYNTIYQLFDDLSTKKLEKAKYFLMIPAYFSFLLTGVIANEYTLATTTAILCPKTKNWLSGLPQEFAPILEVLNNTGKPVATGKMLGGFSPEVAKKMGYSAHVILPATHDTASAMAGAGGGSTIMISCGTWSIMGVERCEPVTTKQAKQLGFSNEGGVGGFRFCKNILGMWVMNRVKQELDKEYNYAEVISSAQEALKAGFLSVFDINNPRFFNPDNMISEINFALAEQNLPLPKTDGELFLSVYLSLADAYSKTLQEIVCLTGEKYDKIVMLGGGAYDKFLQELTAKATNLPVLAGAAEATVEGNINIQLAQWNK